MRLLWPSALAAVIKTLPHDIIFCGQRAIDDDSGQVGAMLAEALGLPQLTLVTKLDYAGSSVKVIRPIEGAQLLIETGAALRDHYTKRAERTALRVATWHYESEEKTG